MGKKVIIAHDDLDLKCLDSVAGGWSVKTADNGNEALKLIQRFRDAVVAVVVDLDLPNGEGLTVLRQLRRANPELPVLALTESERPGEAELAVDAGATECAFKPIAHEELVRILQRVTKSEAVCRCTDDEPQRRQTESLYVNREMRAIQRSLQMLAPWDVPVVFLGETGVGKEVAARELHSLSTRAHKPFIKINCAAVPSELLESELFGYEKGAFTGALRSKPGKFELADGGTVLLDEIGDMHSNLQAKLLQVLQDGEFDRLGGRQCMRVDVRVLAATHRDLKRAVETGAFREDLFYRLNVASIIIPPLRERKDEIVPLARRFVIKHGRQNGAELPEIPAPLQQALKDYPWPGNVRELENVIRKFLVFQQPEALAAELSAQTAESNHAAGRGPVRIMPRQVQAAPPLVRNGSNGKESVTAYSSENGFGNGAAAGAPSRIQAINSNGSLHENGREQDLHADFYPLYGKANGHSSEYSQPAARHPEPLRDSAGHDAGGRAFARETEQIADDATTPSGLSFAPNGHDFDDDENAADDRQELHQEIETPQAKGAEPVSTLAQVEELSKEFERRTILAALQRSTWNRKKAAKILEIDYKGLLYKMKKLEIGLNGSGD